MVEQDRKDLNRRFIKVYRLLEARKEIIKSHPTKSKSAFAERLLGSKQYGHIVSQFLAGKRHIDYKHAQKMCKLYDVNKNYMLHGIGEPFDEFVAPQPQAVSDNHSTILYTNMATIANMGISVNQREGNFQYFSLPDVNTRNLVAFDVEGHSMEPLISKGDIVVCKPIDNLQDIKDNDIYAIKVDDRIWVKHIQKNVDKYGRVIGLELISANYLEHPPFTEEMDDRIIKIFKVIRKISRL